MPLIEEAVRIPTAEGLAGILTRDTDAGSADGSAALLLNMGLTYRIGPNRLYVRLARQLASDGIPALRFDFSGVGDSPSRRDAMHFGKSAPLETAAAMDWLSHELGVWKFLLIGICSGARVAFRTACQDERVAGIAMLNLRNLEEDEQSDLREVALSYDAFRALGQKSRWKRVLTGQTDYVSVVRNLARAAARLTRRRGAVQQASQVAEAFRGLGERGVHVALIFSEGEFGRGYLRMVLGSDYDALLSHPEVDERIIPFADHTFSWPGSQDALFENIREWSAP